MVPPAYPPRTLPYSNTPQQAAYIGPSASTQPPDPSRPPSSYNYAAYPQPAYPPQLPSVDVSKLLDENEGLKKEIMEKNNRLALVSQNEQSL